MRTETNLKTLLKIASGMTLAGLVACGGGGGGSSSSTGGGTTGPSATKLVYTNPSPSAGQWGLMKNAASTDSHLILDLMPPSDAVSGFGVGITLTTTGGVTWSKVASGDATYIENVAYTLGSGTQLIQGTPKASSLIAGVYQKGLATTPIAHSAGAVARIALDLKTGTSPSSSVTLAVNMSKELQASGLQAITVVPGTISLQ
ncbi:MAG: hypothetical protein JST05_02655 [Acidobacteria bacterium]|nr:hypothetical protein [Acidobacteriota bacterium]